MQAHEFRPLHADGTVGRRINLLNYTDRSAIRLASKIADARPFEVWRDSLCVYRTAYRGAPQNVPPPRRKVSKQRAIRRSGDGTQIG